MRTLACISSVKLCEVELFALFFEAVGLRPFVTSKKNFFRSMAISSVRLDACLRVCLLTLSFVHDPGRNLEDISMKFGRKLRLNELSRPLNFGRHWSKVKVMAR